jgi:hypothetical protein
MLNALALGAFIIGTATAVLRAKVASRVRAEAP